MASSEPHCNGVSRYRLLKPAALLAQALEQQVSGWIQNNQAAIAHITDVLLAYTDPNLIAWRQDLIDFVNQQLDRKNHGGSEQPGCCRRMR